MHIGIDNSLQWILSRALDEAAEATPDLRERRR